METAVENAPDSLEVADMSHFLWSTVLPVTGPLRITLLSLRPLYRST